MFNTGNLSSKLSQLSKRIVKISFERRIGHIGSCLTTLPIICEVYDKWMLENDVFILSNGHAALALYTVLEEVYGFDANELMDTFGVHPKRDLSKHIYCSTGSLGQGITVAIGYALSKRNRFVNVLISDGECAEGCVWESLKYIHEKNLSNIRISVNMNGLSAISLLDTPYLTQCLLTINPKINIVNTETVLTKYKSILAGLEAHYKVLNEVEYNTLMEMI